MAPTTSGDHADSPPHHSLNVQQHVISLTSGMSSPSACSAAFPETTEAGGGGRKYKGVRLRKWGKWVCEIRLPNSRERIWLGSYDAPEKAARAFDAAFVYLRGPHAGAAGLNFPDSPPPPCRQIVDPQEVQAAALSHANRAHVRAREAAAPAPAQLSTEDCFFTQQGHVTDVLGGEIVAPDPNVDWRTVMENQPPLFSPTAGWGSNAYDYLQALPPGDNDTPMEESDYGASASLWSF